MPPGSRAPGIVCGENKWDSCYIDDGTSCRQLSHSPQPVFGNVPITGSYKRRIAVKLDDDTETEMFIFPLDEFVGMTADANPIPRIEVHPAIGNLKPLDDRKSLTEKLQTKDGRTIRQEAKDYVADPKGGTKDAIKYAVPVGKDVKEWKELLKEMGWKGKAMIKPHKGKDYIVLSGYAGLRQILTGTRYKPDNIKIVRMVIGKHGVGQNVIKGTKLAVFFTVGAEIYEALMSDEVLLKELGLKIYLEIAKTVLGGIAAFGAGLLVGSVTTIAIVPFGVAIVVGIVTGILLDKIAPTDEVVKAMERQFNKLWSTAVNFFNEVGKTITLQISRLQNEHDTMITRLQREYTAEEWALVQPLLVAP